MAMTRVRLSHRAEFLAKPCAHDEHIKQAQASNQQPGDDRHTDHLASACSAEKIRHSRNLQDASDQRSTNKAESQFLSREGFAGILDDSVDCDQAGNHIGDDGEGDQKNAIQCFIQANRTRQVEGILYAGSTDNRDLVTERNEGSKDEQEEKLIGTVGKIAENQGTDGFLTLHTVQELADEESEQGGKGKGNGSCKQDTLNSGHAPGNRQQQSDLCGHGTDGDGKVDSHAGNDRDDQCEHDERIAVQSQKKLTGNIIQVQP